MALDMSQFYQVFFEEAAEHLDGMETMLLDLSLQQPDPEQLNAIFRAAHSIKGSAGTFGFTDLVEVTHILENLLDRIRKGELALRDDMIDAFLDAGDTLKTLLDAHRNDSPSDPQHVASACARLRALTGDTPPPTTLPTAAPDTPDALVSTANAQAEHPSAPTTSALPGSLDVRFILDSETPGHPNPEDLDNTLQALGVLGEVSLIAPPTADQPVCWLRIAPKEPNGSTDIDQTSLREMLEFVAASDSIRIGPASAAPTPDVDDAYGLFDEPASPAPATAIEGEDFGFFDTPTTSNTDTASSGSAAACAIEGEDFGFFEPLPEASPGQESAEPAPSSGADDPKGAYGFFKPLPLATDQADAPPVPAASSPPSPAPARTERRAAAGNAGGAGGAGAKSADTSIRVGIEKVDQLINLVGELVITQAMLAQSADGLDPVVFERLHAGLQQLERNTRDLQESVMSIRMMPMSVVFSRFPRVVRDTAQKLSKQVELITSGENTELDKSLIEKISDPLTHLIRNSLDHGIESPEKRLAAGKQAIGTITLKAFHQGGSIVIEVGDDGAGLNRERILAKARERGMPVSDSLSDPEVWALIFEAGFSTAEQVTEVSGRGVGMDVVKRNIASLGGRIEIESITGLGTRMTIHLPLTLAILDGISVAVGEEIYILPIGCVVESLQVDRAMVKSVSGAERLIQVRGEYLPVLPLHRIFGIPNAVQAFDQSIMVVLESAGSKFALQVDSLVGQHQVVIKSLEANYRKVSGVSGATIMGDGHVAMILDVAALAQKVSEIEARPPSQKAAQPTPNA